MLWSQQSELWNGGFVCSFRFAKSFSLFTGVLALGALHGYFVWLLSSIRSYLELIVSLFVKRTIINFAYQSYYRILLFFVTQRRQSASRHMEQQTTAEWFFFCNIYFSLLDEKWLHFLSICHLWLILVQFILYHASHHPLVVMCLSHTAHARSRRTRRRKYSPLIYRMWRCKRQSQ